MAALTTIVTAETFMTGRFRVPFDRLPAEVKARYEAATLIKQTIEAEAEADPEIAQALATLLERVEAEHLP